jgi:hypothetical protein
MSEVFRPRLVIDEPADVVVASRVGSFLRFLVFPFRIVHAMRPQRERQAAKIAEEFHCRRHSRPL